MPLSSKVCKKFTTRLAILLASFFLAFSSFVFPQSSAPATDVYNKAMAQYHKGHWKEAREYLYQYLAEYSESPLYVTCLYYLALCCQQMGEVKQAISIYHKVMDAAVDENAFWGDMAQKRVESLMF